MIILLLNYMEKTKRLISKGVPESYFQFYFILEKIKLELCYFRLAVFQ